MSRARLAAAAALTVVSLATAAHAQMPQQPSWRPIELRCSARLGEQGGKWPLWAKCVAQHLWGWNDKIQELYAACWVPIWNKRLRDSVCQQCGDPVFTTLSCMQRQGLPPW